ncbi:MAG TPA: VWA domain-containing protein [Thermoanaerobaculia bacterium]
MPFAPALPFAEPRLLALALVAPLAALVAWRLWRRRLDADAAWASRGLWDRLLAGYRPRRLAASVALLAVAVLAVALALAEPRWGAVEREIERRGVDVVFVLDSSLSMNARDVMPSRLFAAETLVRRLVREMPGNRVALVQAEGEGVVMTPLTLDGAVIDLLLDAIAPGTLPVPGTRLAGPLRQALGLFDPAGRGHRVVVLLTDGEDHGGGLGPALDELRRQGVVVHAIGVGTPQGAPVPLPAGARAQAGEPELKRDAAGQVVISRLGEEVLEQIADATGGLYLRATGAGADLGPVIERISAMATRRFESETLDTRAERFQWPLALAALALVAHLAAGPFAPQRPARQRRPRRRWRRARPAAEGAG